MQKFMRHPPEHFVWSLSESEKMDRMLGRLHRIALAASASGKKLMIDAEQTYFQVGEI
jgi:hypothetical protein